MQTQKQYQRTFSFEFFPPKTEKGAINLKRTREELGKLGPKYFSVTFGAGGTTQQGTIETVLDIKQNGFDVAPHLTCVGSTRDNIRKLLENYIANDIKRIVALRGDLPEGVQEAGEFQYANELVEFIREVSGEHFNIEVAAYPECHPQSRNPELDLKNFKLKVDAGANGAITQYFYNIDAYLHYVDDCEKLGIDLPITPGIMPITSYVQLARFSDMCGAEIPRWIRQRLQGFGDDKESIVAFGEDVMTALCEKLLEAGAPGLHFYTMNQIQATSTLWNNLKLSGPN